MAESQAEETFNFYNVLKSLQANELKNKETELKLANEKLILEQVKKQRDELLAKCEEEEFTISQYQKEASLLDEKIPHKKAAVSTLQKELEDVCAESANVKWRQTKARLVFESERLSRQLTQKSMDHRVEELTAKQKRDKETDAEEDPTDMMVFDLQVEKEGLLQEVSIMEKNLQDQEKILEDTKTKITIVKNRNNAVRLRMRRRLEQAYGERCKLDDTLEVLRRRVQEEGLVDLTSGDDWPELQIDSNKLP